MKFCAAAETHGWGTFLAVHAGAQGEAAAKSYRRAEALFFQPGREPSQDELEPGPLGAPDFTLVPIAVQRGVPLVWISVQTADDLGFRLGNVALVFSSEGTTAEVTTDEQGVWQGQVRAGREIEVRRADGELLRLGSSIETSEHVLIRPHWAGSMTDLVIVGTADRSVVDAQRAQLRRYAAVTSAAPRTSRGVLSPQDALVGEPMQELPASDGQPRVFTRRLIHSHVADNLLLAAELRHEQLPTVIQTWLGDYYPEAVRRGFFLVVVQGREVQLFGDDGALIRNDRLAGRAQVQGRMGLYSLVESDRVPSGAIFVDLATARTALKAVSDAEAAPPTLDCKDEGVSPPAAPPPVTFLADLIEPATKDDYATSWQAQLAAGKVALAYYVPDGVFGTLARVGGTGLLEPYPADRALRGHVHTRNRAVVETAGVVYRHYVSAYAKRIHALDPSPVSAETAGKPHPEEQLRDLVNQVEGGPVFPRPAGADEAEWVQLLETLGDTSSYRVIQAYTEKYNQIFAIRSAGSAWLAGEVSIEGPVSGASDAKGKIKLNFEVNTDETDGAIKVKLAAAKPIQLEPSQLKPSQVEVEVDSNGVAKVKGKGGALGPFEIELSSQGVTKLTYQGVSSVYDARQQQVLSEVQVSLRDLVRKALKSRWGAAGEPSWVKDLPDLKVKAQMGMQLSRPEDVEAVYLRSPSRREATPRYILDTLQWSTLNGEEKQALEFLGFDQTSWDNKVMPEATKQPFGKLTHEQQVIVHHYLPAIPTGSDWEAYWSGVERKHNGGKSAP